MSTTTEPLEEPVRQNRRRRGVLGGLVLMAVGVGFLMQAIGIPNASSYLFLALGFAFAAAYLTSFTPYVYLIPASTLLGLAFGLLIPDWLSLPASTASVVFLASLALGFAAAFLIRPARRWPLLPAAILAGVALFELFGSGAAIPAVVQPFFMPGVLIGVGAYLIVGPRAG